MRFALAFLLILIVAFCFGLAGCATTPPPPPKHHFVAGFTLLLCEKASVIELIRDDGFVFYMAKDYTMPEKWGAALIELQTLGQNAIIIELLPNCTTAKATL